MGWNYLRSRSVTGFGINDVGSSSSLKLSSFNLNNHLV